MIEIIEHFSTVVDEYITWDSSVFAQGCLNNDNIVLNDQHRVRIYSDHWAWHFRINSKLLVRSTFSDGKLVCIIISDKADYDDIHFQLYVGEKKILLQQDWYDIVDFQAIAFQLDTITKYDFNVSTVSNILTKLGVI